MERDASFTESRDGSIVSIRTGRSLLLEKALLSTNEDLMAKSVYIPNTHCIHYYFVL